MSTSPTSATNSQSAAAVTSSGADEPPSKPTNTKEASAIGWDAAEDKSGYDGFASYMHHKNRKLREQFDIEFDTSRAKKTPLFSGVVVWVNGYTDPSRLAIRRIMGENGGRFETYFSAQVTHVVASNLATATKLRLMKDNNRRIKQLHFVHPLWISQSLERSMRQKEASYPIPNTTDPTQKSLKSFFKKSSNAKSTNTKSTTKSITKSVISKSNSTSKSARFSRSARSDSKSNPFASFKLPPKD